MAGLLIDWAKDYFLTIVKKPSSYPYLNHVSKFVKYIDTLGLANRPNDVNLDCVSSCIKYYIDEGTINTQGSMKSHIQSIKDFYAFIEKKGKHSDVFSEKPYKQFLHEQVLKFNLPIEIQRGVINIDTIKNILTHLENELEEEDKNSIRYYRPIVLSLFIRLTLIAPAKKQKICSLKLNDFTDDFSFLNLNSVKIKLSIKCRKQIQEILKIKFKDTDQIDKGQELFKLIYGSNFKPESLNAWLCTIIRKYDIYELPKSKQSAQIETIRNTAIKTMIDNFINPAILSRVCGIKIGSLENKYYNEEFYNINKLIIDEKYENELFLMNYFGNS